jgi:hypothetical protein
MRVGNPDRTKLLSQRWKQFGFRANNDKTYHRVSEQMAKTLQFRQNGYYEETMNGLNGIGKWRMNKEQTKIGWQFDLYDGLDLRLLTGYDNEIRLNKRIIRLTPDTLILGDEDYEGPHEKYGHDDWYFTRQK